MSFVFVEQFVAKRFSRRVKYDSDIVRLIIVKQAPQDRVEEKWNFGGNARRRIHAVHGRKKGPVHVRHGVHKKQFLARRCSRQRRRRFRGSHPIKYSKAPQRARCGQKGTGATPSNSYANNRRASSVESETPLSSVLARHPWIADAHTIPSSFPTSASVSAAFNNGSRLCVALTIARSRALPSATVG